MKEELNYSCSENKGADQLRVYREADLRLCFRICKKPVFSLRDTYCDIYTCRCHPFIEPLSNLPMKRFARVKWVVLQSRE